VYCDFLVYIFYSSIFWDTRRWIKSKSTIRSIPTHHRQNPTERVNIYLKEMPNVSCLLQDIEWYCHIVTKHFLTQNSSSLLRCWTFSMMRILLLARSRVDIFTFVSRPSILVNPFSDRYNCSSCVRVSKFSILVKRLLCRQVSHSYKQRDF